ncbi:MAG: Regulatory protein RecX [Berkelbacteria bacterium GW2011_GWA1_36_9]|uniref:Regulatory protein RecX n=1 Tax=Berkelbacteria bacterium GW2011_GWA1_36_9 TaxID=1618331 RepID=A0A0G0FHR8_9BACT|nr:MAG: Regulatory protein RecX [Berkelbacteria bacterium GW2011_GWA1_36_9]
MKNDPLKIALHYLKFRPRSIFEVEEKLKKKKISSEEIDKVITVLKKNQLLDDEKFAKMWVADRNLLKPTGSYLLKLELKKFGIAEEIIENALDGQDEEKQAKLALESKSRLKDASFEKKAGFLQRRGFKIETIYKVLKLSHCL